MCIDPEMKKYWLPSSDRFIFLDFHNEPTFFKHIILSIPLASEQIKSVEINFPDAVIGIIQW